MRNGKYGWTYTKWATEKMLSYQNMKNKEDHTLIKSDYTIYILPRLKSTQKCQLYKEKAEWKELVLKLSNSNIEGEDCGIYINL